MLLKHVSVEFPGLQDSPGNVYSAHIYNNRYEHEVAVVTFREWGTSYEAIEPGNPVVVTYGFPDKKKLYGYVSHIKPNRTRNSNNVAVYIVGPSFPMKQQRQRVFRNVTANEVLRQVAADHGFTVVDVPHTRVWPQISQSGSSDWQLLVKLAKDCGYSLRPEGTTLYFQPMLHEYVYRRESAPKFKLVTGNAPHGGNMYSFKPVIGEAVEYDDAFKGAVAVSGVDNINQTTMQTVKRTPNKATRRVKKPEFFDRFNTFAVVTDPVVAEYEATAAEDRNSFPYRAEVTVLGDAGIRPDIPVFLEGLGTTYSGFWTVLEVTHEFMEESKNSHMYKTHMVVGSNSLGKAAAWEDNRVIESPADTPTRVITPMGFNTGRPAESMLLGPSLNAPRQARASFGIATNRPKQVGRSSTSSSSTTWASKSPGKVKTDNQTSTPYHVVTRLQKKGVR